MIKNGLVFLTIILAACTAPQTPAVVPAPLAIIPLPQQMTPGTEVFMLMENAQIQVPADTNWQAVARFLQDRLETVSGTRLPVHSDITAPIRFVKDPTIESYEAYRLTVASDHVELAAQHPAGAFYAVQSLLQLLPPEVFGTTKSLEWPIAVPTVRIEDAPRFAYRGMHLDVGRHFFSVAAIKTYLDLLAMHKYNTFHWHLTEDQGWRIEIKQYPKLTEVGAYRAETVVGHAATHPASYDGQRYGGFYTQEDIREVVAYAQKRFITIIPEIELPGHAQAAIAAYPELGCTDAQLAVRTTWGVSENVYCPTETTFRFLENVLQEVIDLFPGAYIHIGGDECPKRQWKESAFAQNLMREQGLQDEMELQSYFIRRIEKFLNRQGKRLIGWDEILEGGLAPNATVMSWRGMEGGIAAARAGHDVIMTPNSHCYFDHYQSLHPDEPLAIGGFLPLEKVYDFEPIPEDLPADKHQHILGAQANLWTEYIPSFDHLLYMAFPRAAALAEVVWSAPAQRNYTDFSQRLKPQFQRYAAAGVPAAPAFFDLQGELRSADGQVQLRLSSQQEEATIHYTLDGSLPTPASPVYEDVIVLQETSEVVAAPFVNGQQQGRTWRQSVNMHKAVGKPIVLSTEPAEKYSVGGKEAIVNGIYGLDSHFGGQEWLGFAGKDFVATIDLGAPTAITSVQCRFFQQNSAWIYLPRRLQIYSSTDGEHFTLAGTTSVTATTATVAEPTVALRTQATHLKIVADRYGIIPEGMPGATHEAWLFVGEVVVQ